MKRVTFTELRKLEITTTEHPVSQGTKRGYWPIIVRAGQRVNGEVLAEDTMVETSAKAIKMDYPTLIAMQELTEWFKDQPTIDESTLLRWAFCFAAQKLGVEDETVALQAERFAALWES